jgi:hypothetical protein
MLRVIRTTSRALVTSGVFLRVVDVGFIRGGGGGAGWRPAARVPFGSSLYAKGGGPGVRSGGEEKGWGAAVVD